MPAGLWRGSLKLAMFCKLQAWRRTRPQPLWQARSDAVSTLSCAFGRGVYFVVNPESGGRHDRPMALGAPRPDVNGPTSSFVQASESKPVPEPITPPLSRGIDGAPLETVLPAFEDYAERARTTWGTPGMAIAVVHQDQVVYTKGFGVKKLGGADPIDPHTLFPIGSTSKAFTSALVAWLADAGKLRWGDPVSDHVPSFEMYDPWVTRAFSSPGVWRPRHRDRWR